MGQPGSFLSNCRRRICQFLYQVVISSIMATLGAPVRVSPLIKLCRWSALLVGVYYGSTHFKVLAEKEVVIRAEEQRLAEIRNKELAIEKAKLQREELISLAKATGTKIPEGF